ncbi:MAG TPA: TIR domain-containing protein [Polyangiaceae bacterium]|nr:TIR domain-containing protein [Polyangiaceae bacterium]
MRLPRAFLSHSSIDKQFVGQVAAALGREYCFYDEYCFHAGDDLIEAIDRGIAASAMIVLFASPDALNSEWVELELNKAQEKKLAERTFQGLALGIGNNVQQSNLPAWLRATRFEAALNPTHASRVIRAQLDELVRKTEGQVYVGRRDETASFERDLAGAPPGARIFAFHGLDAIGRRTLLGRVAHDLLGFQRLVEVPVPKGERTQDIAATLASHVEPYTSKDDFQKKTNAIKRQSPDVAARYAASRVIDLVRAGGLPVFVDEGGLLGDDASPTPQVAAVLAEAAGNAQANIALVSARRPEVGACVDVYIKPLSDDETRTLLGLLLQKAGVSAARDDLRCLAEQCKGHPAAVRYAASLSARYGAPVVARDVAKIVDFRSNLFLGYLQKHGLSAEATAMLKLLAFYRALPVRVMGHALGFNTDLLSKLLVELMDLALIHYAGGDRYALAHPVEDAVLRAFGSTGVNHTAVADELSHYLDEAEPEERHIELTRALFRATRYSYGSRSDWALKTVAELLQIAENLFHQQEYDRVIPILRELIVEDPELKEARSFLVRALIHSGLFSEAEEENKWFQSKGLLRDFYFLQGFNLRKQGRLAPARDAYLEAEQRGRKDVTLMRELASCYLHLGEYAEARKRVARALQSDRGNRMVVDLAIVIALRQGDIQEARRELAKLELVDRPEFYLHRRSTIEYDEGNIKEARSSIARAISVATRPTFEMYSQLAKCCIELDEFREAARAIRKLETEYARRMPDVKLGLWCKWETAQGKFENAEAYWKKLSDKSLPVHMALRLDIIRGFLQRRSLSSVVRASLELEKATLEAAVLPETARYPDPSGGATPQVLTPS